MCEEIYFGAPSHIVSMLAIMQAEDPRNEACQCFLQLHSRQDSSADPMGYASLLQVCNWLFLLYCFEASLIGHLVAPLPALAVWLLLCFSWHATLLRRLQNNRLISMGLVLELVMLSSILPQVAAVLEVFSINPY